jgi:hypothetical protein
MNNLLLIAKSMSDNYNALHFACFLSRKANMRITALFIENNFEMQNEWVDPFTGVLINQENNSTISSVKKSKKYWDHQINYYKEYCIKNNIPFDYLIITGEPMHATLNETKFRDVAIIDPELNFYEEDQNIPSNFVKEILSRSECPIILSPEKFTQLEDIYFCFDNSPSSIFAMKQFTYLFPSLRNIDVTLLEIKDNPEENDSLKEEHNKIINWLKNHYNSVYYQLVQGDVNENLLSRFFMEQNKLIVMGAYGRSILSYFFKKSHADVLIRSVDLPLFITHH